MLRTGILVDKTAALGEAHSQYINSLVKEAFEKREERKNDFIKLMSVDTVNTINDRKDAEQLRRIDEFTKRGQEIMKKNPNFNLSAEDKIELNKMGRDLKQFQDIQTRTIQAVDNARKIVALDNGNKWDLQDSLKKISKWVDDYTGGESATEDNLLVPAYVNIGEWWKQQASKYSGNPSMRKVKTKDEDGNDIWRDVKTYAETDVDMLEKSIGALAGREGNKGQLAIKRGYVELEDKAKGGDAAAQDLLNYIGVRKQEILTQSAEEGVRGMNDNYAQLIAASEGLNGVGLREYWDIDKETPYSESTRRGARSAQDKAAPFNATVPSLYGTKNPDGSYVEVEQVRIGDPRQTQIIVSNKDIIDPKTGMKIFGETGETKVYLTGTDSKEGYATASLKGAISKEILGINYYPVGGRNDEATVKAIYAAALKMSSESTNSLELRTEKQGGKDVYVPFLNAAVSYSVAFKTNEKNWKDTYWLQQLRAKGIDLTGRIEALSTTKKEADKKDNTNSGNKPITKEQARKAVKEGKMTKGDYVKQFGERYVE